MRVRSFTLAGGNLRIFLGRQPFEFGVGGTLEVGASQVSSCCIADGRLWITTVAEQLDAPEPDAGRLFVADVGVGAPAVRPFRRVLPG